MGNEHFRIPNTPEGRETLKALRKSINHKVYFIQIHGRKKNRNEVLRHRPGINVTCEVPVVFADEIVVYLYRKKKDEYNSHVLR